MVIDHICTQHVVVTVHRAGKVTRGILTPGQSRHLRCVPAAAPGVSRQVEVQVIQDVREICGRDPGTLMYRMEETLFVSKRDWPEMTIPTQ